MLLTSKPVSYRVVAIVAAANDLECWIVTVWVTVDVDKFMISAEYCLSVSSIVLIQDGQCMFEIRIVVVIVSLSAAGDAAC